MDIDPALLDQLITGVSKPEQLEDVFRTIKKALVERVLGAELTAHLGYASGEEKPEGQANHRNGTTLKTVITDDGSLPLAIPRDRAGTFEPQFVPKNVRRLPGFDAKVLSLAISLCPGSDGARDSRSSGGEVPGGCTRCT